MKADLHVHTYYSGYSTLPGLSRVLRESYNPPELAYRLAKARGMDLVAITDHDSIGGGLALRDADGGREDVIVGCEVTAHFPHNDPRVCVHLNVLDITELQFARIDRLRHDVRDLMPYLREEGIFTSLNHVACGINGPITGAHIAALMPWLDALEVRNGSRLPIQNRTASSLATAHGKAELGGSDAHTPYAIGRTWTEAPNARSREEFLQNLRVGRVVVGGQHGGWYRMAHDIVRAATGFYADRFRMLIERPLDWRRHAFAWVGLAGMPVVALPLLLSVYHFIQEERFNETLLFDLVAHPSAAWMQDARLLEARLTEAA